MKRTNLSDGFGTDVEEYESGMPEKKQKKASGNKRRKRRENGLKYVFLTGMYLALAVVVVALGTGLYTWIDRQINRAPDAGGDVAVVSDKAVNEIVYTQEQVDELLNDLLKEGEQNAALAGEAEREKVLAQIRSGLESGNTTLETIRPLYPESIVVASGGRFHFVPIDDALRKNSFLQENLEVLESGEYQYQENGGIISHKGVDVSTYQGAINWQKVAADGVEFAFIRTALRGYGTGKLVEDKSCDANVAGAQDAGIAVGLYVFSQAISEDEAVEEANILVEKAKELGVEGPLVIDVEKVSDASGRMNLITVEERTAFVKVFCETVKENGYKPMIYFNTEMAALMLNLRELEEYDKWFASYSEILYYPYEYGIWQYSPSGSVDGIEGEVDVNISFSKFWE